MKSSLNTTPAFLLIVFLYSSSTNATNVYSNEQLIERILKIEAQNRNLKEKLEKNTKKTKKRLASIQRIMNQSSERVRFNGFLSAMGTKSNKNVDFSFEGTGVDNRWSFSPDSVVGMQWDYSVAENTSATVQFVSKGAKGFAVEAEWAYFKFKFIDNLSIRGGRFRTPTYHKSETFEVGFSYPWVRPPVDVYISDVTSLEGISLNYHSSLADDWFISWQLAYGSIDEEISKIRENKLSNIILEKNAWKMRVSYSHLGKLVPKAFENITAPTSAEYFILSTGYDDGVWDILLEGTSLVPSKEAAYHGYDSGFLSIARHFGAWQPYMIVGGGDSNSREDSRAEKVPGFAVAGIKSKYHTKSASLGFRYNINPKTAFKMEASYFYGMDANSQGRFKILDLEAKPFPTALPEKIDELDSSATVLTFGIDLIF